MSVRDSLDLIRMVRPQAGTAAIQHEIEAERASSLGAAETRVKTSLAALATATDDRQSLLADARQSVWSYFVQREILGFRRHTDVIQDLGIPLEVLAGLGAKSTSR